ncbi:hypothetical protein BJ741DRAFT_660593 [Chytriomyces cf. hyalinus JEL632]|nr:hypothetical protein BJ741DRAFT_660593 [Chytriomyces cf. hyalinus JEL632]
MPNCFQLLPREILESILVYVPIDSNLCAVGWACTNFSRLVFDDLPFAARHWTFHSHLGAHTVHRYIHGRLDPRPLPLTYKVPFLIRSFIEEVRLGIMRQWRLDPSNELGLRLFETFMKNKHLYPPHVPMVKFLEWAVLEENEGLVRLVLSASGADKSFESSEVMLIAIHNKRMDILTLLMSHVQLNEHELQQCVTNACTSDDNKLILELLFADSRAEKVAEESCVHLMVVSVALKAVGMVRTLLNRYPQTSEVLHQILREVETYDMTAMLLHHEFIDPSANDNAAFQSACDRNNMEVALVLAQNKFVNSGTLNPEFLNRVAANDECIPILKLILDYFQTVDLSALLETARMHGAFQAVDLILADPCCVTTSDGACVADTCSIDVTTLSLDDVHPKAVVN